MEDRGADSKRDDAVIAVKSGDAYTYDEAVELTGEIDIYLNYYYFKTFLQIFMQSQRHLFKRG